MTTTMPTCFYNRILFQIQECLQITGPKSNLHTVVTLVRMQKEQYHNVTTMPGLNDNGTLALLTFNLLTYICGIPPSI